MKYLNKFFFISLCYFVSQVWAASPYNAARNGDLEALRQYRFEGNDLFIPDERGFIPYELAALHADPDKAETLQRHVEVMLWLKEYQADKHRYGKASIGFIQAGLNALDYDAGRPDGIMGERTAEAIRAYQADNDLAETGRPGPQWLGMFYQDALKDAQFKLTKLGYNTRGTDGLMGQRTRNAMLSFRADNNLPTPTYPHVDGELLNALNQQFTTQEKQRKAAIAEKARQETLRQNRYAQSRLKALGYRIGKVDGMAGSKTANALKAFQKKYQLPVTGELNTKTTEQIDTVFLQAIQGKLNALGYRVGKVDGKMGKRTLAAIRQYRNSNGLLSQETVDAGLLNSLNGRYLARENQRKAVVAEAKREKATARTRYVQAGLRTLGYNIGSIDGMMGGKTEKAIKSFQKRYRLKRNGRINDKTFAKMQTIFLKETQRKLNTLGYKVGKPDGRLGKRTQKAVSKFRRATQLSGSGVSADLIAAVDDRYDRRTVAKKTKKPNKQATKGGKKTTKKATKQRTVAKASKTKSQKTIKKVVAKTTRQTRASQDVVKPALKVTVRSKNRKKSKPKTVVKTRTVSKKTSRVGGRAAKGRMSFSRKSGRVIGCNIAGRKIPIEWCEPFYPLPKKNHCEATFKPSGAVINLWCK